MSSKRLQCAAAVIVGALAACSNGSGSLSDAPSTATAQTPTPEPTPTPTPTTPTPPPPTTPEPPPPTPPPPATPEPPPPAPAPTSALTGYWYGTLEPKSGGQLDMRAMIAANGDAQFIAMGTNGLSASAEFVVYGNVCCDSKLDLELSSKRYLNDRENKAEVKAELKSGKLSGKIKIRGDEYELSIDRLSRYDESVALAELAGTYTRTTVFFLGPTSTYTVTVDPSGQLTGSHTNGCVYNGTVTLPDAPRNLMKLNVEIKNCPKSISGSGSMNGTYSGMGVLFRNAASPSDATKRTDIFFHSLIGAAWLGHQPTER
jgi:hypothetical protein